MHGHDTDFIAGDFHVPLHLKVGRAQPCQKSLQRGGRLALIAECQFEKFVERVIGFMAKPLQDTLAAAVAAEQPGIECEWRLGSETAFALFETTKRVPKFAFCCRVNAQGAAQRSL